MPHDHVARIRGKCGRHRFTIIDVYMPGGGVRAAREIKRCSPATGVIALTSAEDRATVVEMLDAGAIGYLVKGASAARILESR